MKRMIIVAATVALLAGCNTTQGGQSGPSSELLGGGIGAILGGVGGSQFGKGKGQLMATGLGAVLGLVAGSSVGQRLDTVDRMALDRSSQSALERNPSGQATTWNNPDTGNSGYTVPKQTYQSSSGQYCREYQTGVIVGGKQETGYGTACRQPDGSWKVVN